MRGCQNYSKTAEHIVGKGQGMKCESFARRLCGGPELKKQLVVGEKSYLVPFLSARSRPTDLICHCSCGGLPRN
jgi:hypothetical protein